MTKVRIEFSETTKRWYVMNRHMKISGHATKEAAQNMADEMNKMDPAIKNAMRRAFREA